MYQGNKHKWQNTKNTQDQSNNQIKPVKQKEDINGRMTKQNKNNQTFEIRSCCVWIPCIVLFLERREHSPEYNGSVYNLILELPVPFDC